LNCEEESESHSLHRLTHRGSGQPTLGFSPQSALIFSVLLPSLWTFVLH